VAAPVSGATENPNPVAGPLRVIVYGLHGNDEPKVVVSRPRLEPLPFGDFTVGQLLFVQNCAQCHAPDGSGSSAPPLLRQVSWLTRAS